MDIPGGVRAASGASDGRESDEDGCLLPSSIEEGRRCQVAPVGIAGESAMSSCAPGMNSPFRNL
jgi:hypothetical protein